MGLSVLTLPGTVMPLAQHEPGTVVRPKIAGATLASGTVIYEDATSGKCLVADASVSGVTQQPTGIVIGESKVNGQSVSVLSAGPVAGFDLSSNSPGDAIYLDASGAIASSPNGTKTVRIGAVRASSQIDPNTGKLKLYIDFFFNPAVAY